MKYLFAYFVVVLLFCNGCTTQNASKDDFNIVLITIDALRAIIFPVTDMSETLHLILTK